MRKKATKKTAKKNDVFLDWCLSIDLAQKLQVKLNKKRKGIYGVCLNAQSFTVTVVSNTFIGISRSSAGSRVYPAGAVGSVAPSIHLMPNVSESVADPVRVTVPERLTGRVLFISPTLPISLE